MKQGSSIRLVEELITLNYLLEDGVKELNRIYRMYYNHYSNLTKSTLSSLDKKSPIN